VQGLGGCTGPGGWRECYNLDVDLDTYVHM